MSRMRRLKSELHELLESGDWRDHLPAIAALGPEALGPLISFLPGPSPLHWRAAFALGLAVARLPELEGKSLEDARGIMRRLMWHMNEESGNIGWGVPEGMACILACSEPLAREFGRVLRSYIVDTGHDDNYIDHPPLLARCFWAVGHLAWRRPQIALPVFSSILQGLFHPTPPVPGQAALCLAKLMRAAPGESAEAFKALVPELQEKTKARLEELRTDPAAGDYEDFDGNLPLTRPLAELADELLQALF